MTYKSVDVIKSMPESQVSTYISELVEEGWQLGDITAIIEELRKAPLTEIHLSEYCITYILAYLREHYEEIESYHVCTTQFCTCESLYVFTWSYKENAHPTKYVFIESQQELRITNTLMMIEAGITDNTFTIEELSGYDAYHNHKDYLLYITNMEPGDLLPNIPKEVMQEQDNTARFSSAIWYEAIQQKEITLAGCGGIGSYVAFLLSRMCPKQIILYDDDKVETVNMAGQLFSSNDLGKYKVDALSIMMHYYSLYYAHLAKRERFVEDSQPTDIMICGFDSMSARENYYRVWLNHVLDKPVEERKHCLFIDGRLAAEEFQVFCLTGDNVDNQVIYENKFLFSDEEADETICSYKQTTYMANMIGSVIVNLFTNFVANELIDHLRELPFLTYYNGESMTFKTAY